MVEKRALMLASVASMIDLFNMDNIKILKDLGYKVDVACNFEEGSITSQERVNEFRKELEENGIHTYQLPIPRSVSKVKQIFDSYKLTKKLVEKNKYQIVHCHSPIGGVICRLACRKARKYGTKVIYTAHGFHFYKGASKKAWMIFYPVEKFCSKYTDILITINKEDYNRAKKFKAQKIEYVPGIGIHTKELQETEVDKAAKRQELGLTEEDFVIMSTGQLSIRKNHEVIIRALAKINEQNVKYLIVGFGELENYLKNLAKELNIEDRIVFAGYRNDVKEILHAVDAFAFPSLQEGLPVSLMEAMAVGLPIVCSNIRGNVDLIENNINGYLYRNDDIEGFAEGINKLVNNSSDMSRNNLMKIRKFDIAFVGESMKKIYINI